MKTRAILLGFGLTAALTMAAIGMLRAVEQEFTRHAAVPPAGPSVKPV